jgi:ABC-type nitrate/sulfonate/bicarbonate transport system substrate-binding protein
LISKSDLLDGQITCGSVAARCFCGRYAMVCFGRVALLSVVLLVAGTMHGWAQQTGPQQTRLSVMVYRGGQNLPLFVAQEQGFFQKRGLSVELINAPNSDELPKGLVDGRWQIIHSTSDNAVKIVDVDRLDVALIIGGDNAHNHIIAQKDIKSLADLKGKTIVLDGADTGYAYAVYAILEKYGLKKGDYNLNLVGATPKRLEALLNDPNNKAGMINPPFSIQAVRAGLVDLGATVSFIGPYQGPAGYTLRSWAREHSDTLVDYLQSYIEAVRWTLDKANKAKATEILARRLSLSPDVAEDVYAIITGDAEGFARDGKFDIEGFKNVLALRAAYEGKPARDPQAYLDLSYYDRALRALNEGATK